MTTQPDDELWSAIGDPSRRRVPHQVLWWQRLGQLDVGEWLAQRPQVLAAQGLAAVMVALASWQVFGWMSTFQPVIGDVGYAIELVAASPAVTYLGTAQIDFQRLGVWSVISICGWLISESGLIGRRPVPDLVVRGGQASASTPALQVPLSRQVVAEHLAVLEQAGLIICRQEGERCFARWKPPALTRPREWRRSSPTNETAASTPSNGSRNRCTASEDDERIA